MLPKNLKYGSKVEGAPAKSTRINIQPQGPSTYGLGDNIIINIPTRRNLVLVPSESYLKFNFRYTNSTGGVEYYRWDSGGAHSVIQRLRCFHGSNLLEDIDSYGMLAKMLMDLQVNTPSTTGKYNILAGTRADILSKPTAVVVGNSGGNIVNGITATSAGITCAQLADVLNSVLTQPCTTANSGDYLGAVATTATSTVKTYCLNLVSMLGSLCQNQYIPLFAMDSAPLRLEIQLQDQLQKILTCVAGTGTMIIDNVEYVANFIELSDEAVNMIVESQQGEPLQFVLPSWRNYQFTSGVVANTSINMPIPAKFSSLKSLFVCQRDRNATVRYAPLSSVSSGLASYQFRLGSNIVPAKAPSTTAEYFAECLKAIGSMCDVYHSPSIDFASYSTLQTTQEAAQAGNALYPYTIVSGVNQSGSFYIGLDLENYANAPKDSIFAGYNSNTDDIYAVLSYGGTVSASANLRLDAYALFDQVLVFANGTAFVRF